MLRPMGIINKFYPGFNAQVVTKNGFNLVNAAKLAPIHAASGEVAEIAVKQRIVMAEVIEKAIVGNHVINDIIIVAI